MKKQLQNFGLTIQLLFRLLGLYSVWQLLGYVQSGRIKVVSNLESSFNAVSQGAIHLQDYLIYFLVVGTLLLVVLVGLDLYRLVTQSVPTWWSRGLASLGGVYSVGGPAGLWSLLVTQTGFHDVLLRVGPYRLVDAEALTRKREHTVDVFVTGCKELFEVNRHHYEVNYKIFQASLDAAVQSVRAELTDWQVTSYSVQQLLQQNHERAANLIVGYAQNNPIRRSSWAWVGDLAGWTVNHSGTIVLFVGVGGALWIFGAWLSGEAKIVALSQEVSALRGVLTQLQGQVADLVRRGGSLQDQLILDQATLKLLNEQLAEQAVKLAQLDSDALVTNAVAEHLVLDVQGLLRTISN